MKQKKASVEDTFFLAIMLIIIAIIFVFSLSIMQIGNAVYQNSSVTPAMSADIQETTDNYPGILDNMFLAMYIGSFLAVILLSLRISTDPAYFFVAVLFMFVIGIVVPFILNAYFGATETAEGAVLVQQFTIIPWIMGHYLQMGMALIMITIIALYSKGRLSS